MKVKVLAAIACVVALAFGADAAVAAHVELSLIHI